MLESRLGASFFGGVPPGDDSPISSDQRTDSSDEDPEAGSNSETVASWSLSRMQVCLKKLGCRKGGTGCPQPTWCSSSTVAEVRLHKPSGKRIEANQKLVTTSL